MKKVLVVAAHPDDEVLGCGGTILRHTAEGDRVHALIMAEGVTSRDEKRNTALRSTELTELHSASERVANFMGIEKLTMHSFPDNRMDTVALLDIVKKIEEEKTCFQPDIVYTHHAGDVNIDHHVVHDAVVTACRPLPGESVKEVYFFETMSSTEWQMSNADKMFMPNVYIDISEYLEKKIEALHFYASEMREYPHSRSYEALRILAAQRGFTVGDKAMEAFMLGRIVR